MIKHKDGKRLVFFVFAEQYLGMVTEGDEFGSVILDYLELKGSKAVGWIFTVFAHQLRKVFGLLALFLLAQSQSILVAKWFPMLTTEPLTTIDLFEISLGSSEDEFMVGRNGCGLRAVCKNSTHSDELEEARIVFSKRWVVPAN